MSTTPPLRGFTTISYWAADLEAAKRWYTELLGIEPYFQRQGYCEFRLSDYQHELGLIESTLASHQNKGAMRLTKTLDKSLQMR